MNMILKTDSYKTSHFLQYPAGTRKVSSYIEARGVSSAAKEWFPGGVEIVNMGVSRYIIDYLSKPISYEDIYEAQELCRLHGVPFNVDGWRYIVESHAGFLPIIVQSLPEGMVAPIGTPQVQVVNMDERVPWVTSYIETSLLRAIWYPSTVATISREIKKRLKPLMDKSCDNLDKLDFMLHDFGARGASSGETASIGGLAHLVNFKGTDTLEAIADGRRYYDMRNIDIPGYSLPAAEHSTITAWGKDRESDAYANMVAMFSKPGALYSVVSDSYDIYDAVGRLWGEELKGIVQRSGGTLVVRPDSGDPNVVVPRVLELLAEKFGFAWNTKGYKVLNPCVRVIQGDGMNPSSMMLLANLLVEKGWSLDNVAFGMGGGLLQNVTRDTFKYAMKASAALVGDKWVDVYKDPVTDRGKVSKRGIQHVYSEEGSLIVSTESRIGNLLAPVWGCGHEHTPPKFYWMRELAKV